MWWISANEYECVATSHVSIPPLALPRSGFRVGYRSNPLSPLIARAPRDVL
jgi:hypothetical protein